MLAEKNVHKCKPLSSLGSLRYIFIKNYAEVLSETFYIYKSQYMVYNLTIFGAQCVVRKSFYSTIFTFVGGTRASGQSLAQTAGSGSFLTNRQTHSG